MPKLLLLAPLALIAVTGCFPNVPAVSPDGKHIALCLTSSGELEANPAAPGQDWRPHDLYIANLADTDFPPDGIADTTVDSMWRVTDLTQRGNTAYSAAEPSYAPDGESLVFVVRQHDDAADRLVRLPDLHLGRRPTLTLRELYERRMVLVESKGVRMLAPRISPDGRHIAWIETAEWNTPEQDAAAYQKRFVSGGYHGRLRVIELGPRGGVVELQLPGSADELNAVIPDIAWRNNGELVCARRTGDRQATDAAFTCRGEVVRVVLPHGGSPGEVVVRWSGSLLAYQAGVAAHPAGTIIVHDVNLKTQQGQLKMIAPDGTVSTLVADGYNRSPRFDLSGGKTVLRWYSEAKGANPFAWTSGSCAMPFDADGKPAGARDDVMVPIDTSDWKMGSTPVQVKWHPLEFLRGMLTGTSGALGMITGVGRYFGDDFPKRFDGRRCDTQQLMLYSRGSDQRFDPMMDQVIHRVRLDCPDKYEVLDVARRTTHLEKVDDSVLLFNVKLRKTNDQGQTEIKTGEYLEFVKGDKIRTEEKYAGDTVTTWNGKMVGHKAGASAPFTLVAPGRGVKEGTAKIQLGELREKLRLRQLFLLQQIEEPGDREDKATFEFSFHSLEGQVALEGARNPSLIYLRRRASWKKDDGSLNEEIVYIGFQIVDNGGEVRVWPREVRTMAASWLRTNENGEQQAKRSISVIRFVGDFLEFKEGRTSDQLVNLPAVIKLYNIAPEQLLPAAGLDFETAELGLEATLMPGIRDYAHRNNNPPRSGINMRLPDACFSSEKW